MILIGVALEVLATIAGTVGKQLIRYSKLIEGKRDAAFARACFGAGVALNVLFGPNMEVVAYSQAPQTLLAPLNGLDVLWNVLLVPHTLGEQPSTTQFFGCVLLVVGTALTADSGPHHEPPYTLEVLRARLLTDSALTYIACELALLAVAATFIRSRPRGDRRRGFALGCLAGGIGGNLFCMKAASSLISTAWHGGFHYVLRVWTSDPLPALVAVSAGAIGAGSAVLLAGAMREHEATMMVATYEGAFVISGCASGCAVLGELDPVSPARRVLYAFGVLVVVAGVLAAQHAEEEELRQCANGDHQDANLVPNGWTNGKTAPLLKVEERSP